MHQKSQTQNIKVYRLLQNSFVRVNVGDWVCIVCGLDTIIVLVLFAFDLIPQKITPLTNSVEIMIQGLCNCYSIKWKWNYRATKVES